MATLSQLQLLSGEQKGLLECSRALPKGKPRKDEVYKWHHLGWGWLLSIRHFLHSVREKVIIPTAWRPQLVREGDMFIMDEIRRKFQLSEWEMALVNSVRLYLRAQTLADITTMEGTHIEGWAMNGSRQCTSSLRWPQQARPGAEAIHL